MIEIIIDMIDIVVTAIADGLALVSSLTQGVSSFFYGCSNKLERITKPSE